MSHLDVVDLIIVLLHVAISAVAVSSVAFIFATLSSGFDADVLGGVRLLVEFVSEVLGHDEATVLVVLLEDDSLKLLANGDHDLVEAERHRLVSELTDVLGELPVNFLSDTGSPGSDLIVGKLDLLVDLFGLFIFLLVLVVLPVQLSELRGQLGFTLSVDLVLLLVLVVVHLELLELLTPLLVVHAELVDFSFVFGNVLKERGVSLFTGQEKVDDFLNIRVAGSSSNLLESTLDFEGTVHLTLHLSFHEGTPEALR